MYFQLMYHSQNREYHARLYSSANQLLAWTHSSHSQQVIINICEQIKREGIGLTTPIRDAIPYS